MTVDLGPTPDQLTRIRSNVLAYIERDLDQTPYPARKSRTVRADADADADAVDARRKRHVALKRAGWISGSTLAAAAVATALVMSNIVGLAGWRGGADAAAAASLSDAATATIHITDPTLSPGQFLKISTRAMYASSTNGGAAYLVSQNRDTYIPADPNADVTVVRYPETVAQTFGPESQAAAAQAKARQATSPIPPAPQTYQVPGGRAALPTGHPLSEFPRDPQQLLNYIYRVTLGQGPTPDGEALTFIADTLRTGLVPADLRAALYRAVACIPGVTITEQQATLDGRTGIAYGRDDTGFRQEIIIDPTAGQLIGERYVVLREDPQMKIPAGQSYGWTAVTTTVVDTTPAATG